jgi:hypothetical protein
MALAACSMNQTIPPISEKACWYGLYVFYIKNVSPPGYQMRYWGTYVFDAIPK